MNNPEILPYYKNSQQWKSALDNWIKAKEAKKKFTQEEIECYFFSAFSCANYNAYEKGIALIKKNTKINVKFHTLVNSALKLYLSGQYNKAEKLAKEAAEHVSENKNERLYFFQLYKEIRLKNALAKRKPIKEKLSYLEYKYFEISGNILYSTDVLGIVLFLKYKKHHSNSSYASKIKNTINKLYEKIKNFKGDLNKLELYLEENKSKELFVLSKLTQQKKELQAMNFSGIQLIILSKLLATGMHMQASFTARQLAKEYFIKNKETFYKKHNVLYLYSVRACLEEEIPICLKGFTHPERYLTALEYSKLYTEKKNNYILNIAHKKNDKEYLEYIKNKKIALVGPVNTGLDNGDEIDSYDIVVRLNTTNTKNYPKKVFGEKTSAAYFVRGYFLENQKEIIDSLHKLDFISIHTIKDDELFKLIRNNKKIRSTTRYHERINNIFFSGYPNLIQRAALDLLRFSPKEIKIFNANLWIKNIPSDYYIYKQEFYPANLILHDAYSNFALTRLLFKNNHIDTDSTLKKILNMSIRSYAEKLTSNYDKENN